MTQTPKNPNVARVAGVPFEKDAISPMPQFAPRSHGPGSAPGSGDALPQPPDGAPAPDKEEYPGPQTASSGERAEPGRTADGADGNAKGGPHGRA